MPQRGSDPFVEQVRAAMKAADRDATTSGEDAAVYNDYTLRHGMQVLAREPRFYLEAAALFVEGAQIGRLHLETMPDALSFDRPEHREMVAFLGRILGYYRQDVARKFLRYGQLMRPLEFTRPNPLPTVTDGEGAAAVSLPVLQTGVFRAADGELGAFVVNIGTEAVAFAGDLDLARHGLAADVPFEVETIGPEGVAALYRRGVSGRLAFAHTLPAHQITLLRFKPSGQQPQEKGK